MTAQPRGNFYLKETDEDIIRWCSEYQYLQPLHVQLLSNRNIIAVRRRLRQLHEQDFLMRTTVPFARSVPVWSPPDQYVYYLSRKGVASARELGFTDENARYNAEKSEVLLPHDLFLTTFHLTLQLATLAAGSLHLIFWEQRRSVLQDSVVAGHERYSVNPDALFFLKDDTKPTATNTSYFFLEYERSRPTGHARGESNFIRKMRALEEYHRTGGDTKRWGIPNFRALVVTPTSERAVNLCRSLADGVPPLASKRFWFTNATHVSLDRPSEILEEIFFTPADISDGLRKSLRS